MNDPMWLISHEVGSKEFFASVGSLHVPFSRHTELSTNYEVPGSPKNSQLQTPKNSQLQCEKIEVNLSSPRGKGVFLQHW